MCSINGFNFKDESLIRKMVKVTRHRGPDQEGFYCDENFSLGQARLSIIDLSENGRQPLWNESRSICIICNGEIYNFQELRKELQKRGHRFRSRSDTEVILHLYEEKKEKCLQFLNGIFAFAILDLPQKLLFLARDRIGVKPLYYYFNPARSLGQAKFIFSSEIKGILQHDIKREVDLKALNHYFRLEYVPCPQTMFKNIFKLPPASYLILKKNQIEIKKYWDLTDFDEIQSKNEILEKIRSLMKESVRSQLVSDRPLGIFLSGGIDSTSVLGIVSQILSGKIKTYSVGFDVEPKKFNRDFELARQTAKYYNTDHHELLITGLDVRNYIEKVIYHLDEPISNPIQIPTFLLSKEAKKEVAVVLGGDGGDELFGGYSRYWKSKIISQYQLFPKFLREKILSPFIKKEIRQKLNIPPGPKRYLQFMAQKDEILTQVLRPEIFQQGVTEDFFGENFFKEIFADFEKQFMIVDLKTWLVDESLMRTDKMTMAHGLEERVPVLDHRLVELSVKIPTKLKLKGKDIGKWIFIEAMKEYLPSHVLGKEKRGWFSPAAKWLRGDLKDFAFEVLSESYCPETQLYFNFSKVRKILENHIEGCQYNLGIIWLILTFQLWYHHFISHYPRR